MSNSKNIKSAPRTKNNVSAKNEEKTVQVPYITMGDPTDIFDGFASDRDRIKAISASHKGLTIAQSFATYYKMPVLNELKKASNTVNIIRDIKIGDTLEGVISSWTDNMIEITTPDAKIEMYCKENFNDCKEAVQNYLLNHNNMVFFKVKEKRDGKYFVSIIDGFYQSWVDSIEEAIKKEQGIEVHIDSLTTGGYLCHTPIWTLNAFTGKNYTGSVFIPGSHIVLNIETDFDKWVGEDVMIVPQKFVKYRSMGGPTENSLVGSRKRVLQIEGWKNLYEIYNNYLTITKLSNTPGIKYTPIVFQGVVTGIINSAKKTGIFVELTDKNITGLMPVKSSELLNFKPGDEINVTIKEFEVQEGRDPFIIRNGHVKRCNTRPVFKLA